MSNRTAPWLDLDLPDIIALRDDLLASAAPAGLAPPQESWRGRLFRMKFFVVAAWVPDFEEQPVWLAVDDAPADGARFTVEIPPPSPSKVRSRGRARDRGTSLRI